MARFNFMTEYDIDDLIAPSGSDDVFSDYIADSEVDLGDYDEDGCYHIDAFNGLLEDYLNKSRNMFTDGFKNLIRQVYIKQRKLDKLSKRMWERKNALEDMQKEIDDAKNTLNKYKEDVTMNYIKELGLLPYKPGQKVYVVGWEEIKDGPCPRCNGKSKLFIEVDGLKYETGCPNCNPKNENYSFLGKLSHKEYFIKEAIITGMYFSLYAGIDKNYYARKECKTSYIRQDKGTWDDGETSKVYIKYLDNNNDDTITEWSSFKLFGTKEEAEEYIESCKQGPQVPKFTIKGETK